MARWLLWASTVITAVITFGAQPDLRSMLTLTLAALAIAMAVALIAAMIAVPAPSGRVIAVQVRREAPIAPRQCDPDAAGRPRPRAPSIL